LHCTSRFGFAGVPNALNLELSPMGLFKVALVVASWRVVSDCSRKNAPSPLRLACCARGRVVLYRSRGRPPTPPYLLRSHPATFKCRCTNKRCSLVCTPTFESSWVPCSQTTALPRAIPAAPYAGAQPGALHSRTCGWLRLYSQPSGLLSRRWGLPPPHSRFPLCSTCLAGG
jgi:hypothetical protein